MCALKSHGQDFGGLEYYARRPCSSNDRFDVCGVGVSWLHQMCSHIIAGSPTAIQNIAPSHKLIPL